VSKDSQHTVEPSIISEQKQNTCRRSAELGTTKSLKRFKVEQSTVVQPTCMNSNSEQAKIIFKNNTKALSSRVLIYIRSPITARKTQFLAKEPGLLSAIGGSFPPPFGLTLLPTTVFAPYRSMQRETDFSVPASTLSRWIWSAVFPPA
jgi:hypothetical protein